MTTDDVQTNLRMPADLKDRLQEAAKRAGRTMTAEVVFRLEQSFAGRATQSRTSDMTDDWERMRALRHRAGALAAEYQALQQTKIDLQAAAPKDSEGRISDERAQMQVWEVSSRLYELQKRMHETEREMDLLYEKFAVSAPGAGRGAMGAKPPN